MEDLLQTRSDDLARLAGEQAALRRVATLAASGVPAQELLAVVSEEVGQLLAVDIAGLTRYEPEGDLSVVAAWSRAGIQVSTPRRWNLGGEDVSTIVAQTKRSARIDRFGEASGDELPAHTEPNHYHLRISSHHGLPCVIDWLCRCVRFGSGDVLTSRAPVGVVARGPGLSRPVLAADLNPVLPRGRDSHRSPFYTRGHVSGGVCCRSERQRSQPSG